LKSGRVAESLAEHRTIMNALIARDAQGAAQYMRAHFANGLNAAA
jgi:DNA-binding GntR family transcriptional regulator